MSKKILVVTAHPDDESLWFSSVLNRNKCDVVCVTCGEKGSPSKKRRRKELEEAVDNYGVKKLFVLGQEDVGYERRLDIKRIEEDIKKLPLDKYDKVFTHGPYGDMNEHPHHQDVCYVVHKCFKNVFCTAWNLFPDLVNNLTENEYHLKKRVMGTIYNKEYRKLKTTYEISSIEKFVSLSKEAVEIFYWSIANFGDNHEMLMEKGYSDIWGYENSKYEKERHNHIVRFAKKTETKKCIEIGAHEGTLTAKLKRSKMETHCIEKAPSYKKILEKKGFHIIDSFDRVNQAEYGLTIIASVLEYMKNPKAFLNNIKTRFVIVETISTSNMNQIAESLRKRYKIVEMVNVLPRWENMYHGGVEKKLEVYKIGCNIYLFEKK